jgi:hypothetical protein
VVLKVYKFQICLFTPPLGDFQQGSGDLSIGCGMFLEYISPETMLSGSKILPTTGRSTPLYHYMDVIYVVFTNFQKNIFGTLYVIPAILQHMMIWYILRQCCNITRKWLCHFKDNSLQSLMNSPNGLNYPQCSLDMFIVYQDHFCIIWGYTSLLGRKCDALFILWFLWKELMCYCSLMC